MLELEVALGNVVADAVAGDMGHGRLVVRQVFGAAADHHAELDLPVGLGAAARDQHIVVRPAVRARRLGEDHRLRRQVHPRFLGVIGEVEADGDEVPGPCNRRADSRAGIDDREATGAFGQDCRQPPDAAAFKPSAVDFADRARYIDDGSVVLHHGRPLGTRLANSQQLHLSSPGSEGARTIPAPPTRTSPATCSYPSGAGRSLRSLGYAPFGAARGRAPPGRFAARPILCSRP